MYLGRYDYNINYYILTLPNSSGLLMHSFSIIAGSNNLFLRFFYNPVSYNNYSNIDNVKYYQAYALPPINIPIPNNKKSKCDRCRKRDHGMELL